MLTTRDPACQRKTSRPRGLAAGAGTFDPGERNYFSNVFAIIPWTSADAFTMSAMLAAW